MTPSSSSQLSDAQTGSKQKITLRVVQGASQGLVFHELETPISIGREADNSLQLNDERVSRHHAKIEKEDEHFVIADLTSTNGTKINGHETERRKLSVGDTVSVGKTLLVVGSKAQIREWLSEGTDSGSSEDLSSSNSNRAPSTGLAHAPPKRIALDEADLPTDLTTVQAEEIRELLGQLHQNLGQVLDEAKTEGSQENVSIKQRDWHTLLMTQSSLSQLLRRIAVPHSAGEES